MGNNKSKSKGEAGRTFAVSIPIAGYITVQVTAADERLAKVAAWAVIDEKSDDAGELYWEFFDCIAEGNVCHAPLVRTEAVPT